MKGVIAAAMVIAALLVCCGIAVATPPIVPPVQYEQFCENQKVSGTGVIDVSTSIIDKQIALEYYNMMTGDGDFELDQEQVYSQNSDKLKRNLSSFQNGEVKANLNLYENTKMTYASKDVPLVGGKYLHSKKFYGGIGADVQEMFAVNEMEKEQEAFFSSTQPYDTWGKYGIPPEQFANVLKGYGRNTEAVEWYMDTNPTHLIGIDTKNTFNGTWGTDAKWHRIFYKDIKAHEMFTGKFEAEKLLKFHEYPVPEREHAPCEGIDC
ncbi:MAG: hypothetical protein MUO26_01300 [Methanotrichaceae archaeon]|nr:hypothetical protein [Methanotrichaceae archaeon]